jgi:Tol biopolymer transport system component
VVLACAALAVLVPGASATPPGRNGLIVCHQLTDSPAIEDSFLYTVDPTSGEERQIALDRFLWSGPAGPSWAPDGAHIAFAGPADPDPASGAESDIFVNDLVAPGSRNLTGTPEAEASPAWSPDGRYIAYERHDPAGPAIWRMRTTGKSQRRLIAGALDPAWSPDGRRLAFSLQGDIFTSSAHGHHLRRVTADADTDRYPTWSPDGTRLAWTSDLGAAEGTGEIWIARTDGADAVRLTNNTNDDLEPVWSPDQRFIAVARGGGPGDLLYVVDVSSGSERHLGHACSGPDWQRVP